MQVETNQQQVAQSHLEMNSIQQNMNEKQPMRDQFINNVVNYKDQSAKPSNYDPVFPRDIENLFDDKSALPNQKDPVHQNPVRQAPVANHPVKQVGPPRPSSTQPDVHMEVENHQKEYRFGPQAEVFKENENIKRRVETEHKKQESDNKDHREAPKKIRADFNTNTAPKRTDLPVVIETDTRRAEVDVPQSISEIRQSNQSSKSPIEKMQDCLKNKHPFGNDLLKEVLDNPDYPARLKQQMLVTTEGKKFVRASVNGLAQRYYKGLLGIVKRYSHRGQGNEFQISFAKTPPEEVLKIYNY